LLIEPRCGWLAGGWLAATGGWPVVGGWLGSYWLHGGWRVAGWLESYWLYGSWMVAEPSF
jgi:hypothetical protein